MKIYDMCISWCGLTWELQCNEIIIFVPGAMPPYHHIEIQFILHFINIYLIWKKNFQIDLYLL